MRVHTQGQAASQNHMSWWTVPREEHEWLLSQREHSSPGYFTQQLRTRAEDFYYSNWGADPASDRAMTSTEQKGPTQHHWGLWSPQHQTHPLWREQWPAYSEERCSRHPYQKQPSHQKYLMQTGYTGIRPHKNSPSRPPQIIFS